MKDKVIFGGLCALLLFLPIPFGSVYDWSRFVFQAIVLVLFGIHLAGTGSARHGEPDGQSQVPAVWKALLGVFFTVTVFQLLPLPSPILRLLSPRTEAFHRGLLILGVPGLGGGCMRALSYSPSLSLAEGAPYFGYLIFGWLVCRYLDSRKKVAIFVRVMVGGAVFQAVYGLTEYLSGSGRIFGWKNPGGAGAAFGTFVNRNHFSGFLEMILPLSVALMMAKVEDSKHDSPGAKTGRFRLVLWMVFPVILSLGIYFSRSRAGIISLAVSLLAMAISLISWKRPHKERDASWKKPLTTLGIIVLIVTVIWLIFGFEPIAKRFSRELLAKSGRQTYAQNTLKLIRDYPLWGTGLGTFSYAHILYERYYDPDTTTISHAHNDYLEVLAESGLIGGGALILAALGSIGFLYRRWRRRPMSEETIIGLGCLAGLVALLVHSFADFNLRIPANAVFFIALWAVARRTILGSEEGFSPIRAAHGTDPVVRRNAPNSGVALRKGLSLLGSVALLTLSSIVFFRSEQERRFQALKAKADNLALNFPALVEPLTRAVGWGGIPVYDRELGQLYLEKALSLIPSGGGSEMDAYLLKAEEAYIRGLRRNPLDALLYGGLGMVYQHLNYPLFTYQEKGRRFLRQSVELRPANMAFSDEFLYAFLRQWGDLRESEKSFVFAQVERKWMYPYFLVSRWRERWIREFGDDSRLKEIFSRNLSLWPKIRAYFQ
jgi:O-antigen ligase